MWGVFYGLSPPATKQPPTHKNRTCRQLLPACPCHLPPHFLCMAALPHIRPEPLPHILYRLNPSPEPQNPSPTAHLNPSPVPQHPSPTAGPHQACATARAAAPGQHTSPARGRHHARVPQRPRVRALRALRTRRGSPRPGGRSGARAAARPRGGAAATAAAAAGAARQRHWPRCGGRGRAHSGCPCSGAWGRRRCAVRGRGLLGRLRSGVWRCRGLRG